jgi:hypothetical protein
MPVNDKMKAVTDVEADLQLVSALWGGTRTMRAAGKEFLPQEAGEEKEDYNNRKNRTTLTNIFKKTINTFVGRIFETELMVENAPAFSEFLANVDYESRDFHRFVYDLSRFTMRDGLRFIMVDSPVADGVKTKADETAAGIRPYFIEVDRRNVLGWKTEVVAGEIIITQFRMVEVVSVSTGEFTVNAVEQIRVIEPNLVRLYRKDSKKEWVLHKTIRTSIDFVPIVPVFADRQGYLESTPPLLDLAWLNVEHWQKSSDQSNILHVARVPILHWSGYKPQYDAAGEVVDLVISPNTMAKSADPNAKLEYVEHSGAAIGAGHEDLIYLEDRMVALGAEFTSPKKSGSITATEKAINESGDISELSAFALNLKDSLVNALNMAGKMMGVEFNGDVLINTELGLISNPVNTTDLIKIRALGDISRKGMFEVLNKEWGSNLDNEVESERLADEPPAF